MYSIYVSLFGHIYRLQLKYWQSEYYRFWNQDFVLQLWWFLIRHTPKDINNSCLQYWNLKFGLKHSIEYGRTNHTVKNPHPNHAGLWYLPQPRLLWFAISMFLQSGRNLFVPLAGGKTEHSQVKVEVLFSTAEYLEGEREGGVASHWPPRAPPLPPSNIFQQYDYK